MVSSWDKNCTWGCSRTNRGNIGESISTCICNDVIQDSRGVRNCRNDGNAYQRGVIANLVDGGIWDISQYCLK